MLRCSKRAKFVLLAAGLVATVALFSRMLLRELPVVFNDPVNDMYFAWCVPLFSLHVLISERKALASAAEGSCSIIGLVALLFAVVLGVFCVSGGTFRQEMLAFIAVLFTLPWALFGGRMARHIAFPVAFLLFMVPMAEFLAPLSKVLRMIGSVVSIAVLKCIGSDAVRHGTLIVSSVRDYRIEVADCCSGLRSIFALLALTAAYAHFTQRTFFGKGLLFLLAAPIAFLANLIRIVLICVLAEVASRKFALGFYHDYSGYVMFLLAVAMVIVVGELLLRGKKSAEEVR